MSRFRKKPEEFEAEQYLPGQTYPRGVHPPSIQEEAPKPYVITAHGQRVYLEGGEWIVREKTGDGYYPIRADIMPLIADQLTKATPDNEAV